MSPESHLRPDQREIVTPEGLTLRFTLAGRSARLGALAVDLACIGAILLGAILALVYTQSGLGQWTKRPDARHAAQFLFILWTALMFLLRNGWFLIFELGPRGATPGKRMLGLRIAARDGARLTTEMVLARNLLRDIEIFLPMVAVFSALGSSMAGGPSAGMVNWAAAGWFLLFALFPLFNRDRLRAGDMIAGTWVVEAPRARLEQALSAKPGAHEAPPDYAFGPAELAVYGEYELQTLERVLREGHHDAMEAVAHAICAKIGWNAPQGDEVRRFLDAYYTALRARLEQGLRFGRRKMDKFDGAGR
ncbi:putative RDD family membrane protein YckC [Novosphingobium sp. SG751A]|uniref:RDD family protein n=1 Tax=Novosphingobium sp. SG751A TaxID=2587000 RepID=UPI001552710C|nr:RDD family protein [Novosphingobium sp. SG751A]NOW44803.1 putative RDD family membrane protein YckC [Novosphingobium sp. SG751A]